MRHFTSSAADFSISLFCFLAARCTWHFPTYAMLHYTVWCVGARDALFRDTRGACGVCGVHGACGACDAMFHDTAKITALPSGNLSQTLNLENLGIVHRPSSSVINKRRSSACY